MKEGGEIRDETEAARNRRRVKKTYNLKRNSKWKGKQKIN